MPIAAQVASLEESTAGPGSDPFDASSGNSFLTTLIADLRELFKFKVTAMVLITTWAGFYLGSENSLPLWANVPQMMDNQRRINPDAFRKVV